MFVMSANNDDNLFTFNAIEKGRKENLHVYLFSNNNY